MRNYRPIEDVVADMRAWHRTAGLSHKEIAYGSGVDLSTVYRIFGEHEHRLRYGTALKRICSFAKISVTVHQRAGEIPPVLREAVLDTWDGTTEHASLLASAIIAVGGLIRQAVSAK